MITFRWESRGFWHVISELLFCRNMLPPSSVFKELHPSRHWSDQGEDVFYLCSLVVRDVARQNHGEGLYPPSPSVVLIGHIPYSPPVYLNNILTLISCSICLELMLATLKMEAALSTELLASSCSTVQCHSLNNYCYKNLNTYDFCILLIYCKVYYKSLILPFDQHWWSFKEECYHWFHQQLWTNP